jgi:ribosomal protein L12E/L44/L45/RPP1/RPP2
MRINAKLMLRWRPSRRQVLRAIAIGSLLAALAGFIFLGYYFNLKWTSFPQERLFDWIQILVIPVAVAIGTFVLNRAAKKRNDEAQQEQSKREEEIEDRREEEAALQAYLDYLSQMLTDPDRPLHRSRSDLRDNLSVIARAQTLTVLGRLQDGVRKRSVLQFINEAGLIRGERPVISLEGANLQEALLQGAELYKAYLPAAHLNGAKLRGANLPETLLPEAFTLGSSIREIIEAVRGNPQLLLRAAPDLLDDLAPLTGVEPEIVSQVCKDIVQLGGEQIGDIRSSLARLAKDLTNVALTLHRQLAYREEGLELFEDLISLNIREARLALDVLDRRPF